MVIKGDTWSLDYSSYRTMEMYDLRAGVSGARGGSEPKH